MKGRQASRAEDAAFLEADDACAICGARFPGRLTKHHIDHDSANTVYDNLIVLCRACHDNHHRGEQPDDTAIRYRKRHLIEKTLTQYGVNALKMAARRRIGVVAMPYMVFHLVELGYLKQEETQMGYSGGDEYIDVTVRFSITQDGRDLLNHWFAQ